MVMPIYGNEELCPIMITKSYAPFWQRRVMSLYSNEPLCSLMFAELVSFAVTQSYPLWLQSYVPLW